MNEPTWIRLPFRPVRAAAARRIVPAEAPGSHGAASAIFRTALAVALSAGMSFGAWQLFRWSTTTPLFAVREIHFAGLVHASQADLLARSSLHTGTNLMTIDLAAAAKAMEAHPWVASARLARSFPGTVLVDIVEHRAAAQVQLGGLYLLDEDGRIFKRAAAEDGADVPLVTGVSRESWLRDKGAARLRLYAALHLLEAWRAEGLPASALEEIRLEEDGGFTAFTRDAAGLLEVRLGARDLPLQLKRLEELRAALARRGEHAARIDLDNQARPEWVSAQLQPVSR